jgi:hypothetical protein
MIPLALRYEGNKLFSQTFVPFGESRLCLRRKKGQAEEERQDAGDVQKKKKKLPLNQAGSGPLWMSRGRARLAWFEP